MTDERIFGARPSKKYLEHFKKYRNNHPTSFYSLFSSIEQYKKGIKDKRFKELFKPMHNQGDNYIDCPWCEGDLR